MSRKLVGESALDRLQLRVSTPLSCSTCGILRAIPYGPAVGTVDAGDQLDQRRRQVGILGCRGISGFSCIHGCAEPQNSAILGRSDLVSSNVPPMINVLFGSLSLVIATTVPHVRQKRRVSVRPLSPCFA